MKQHTIFDSSMVILVFIFLIIIIMTIVIISALQTDPVAEALVSDPVYKVLFVLEDEGQTLGTYVLAFFPETMRAAMFDVPGNVGTIIKELDRFDRMDLLYTEGSIDTYSKAVQNFLKITIPFYITMSLDSFCRVADVLGGLPVFLHGSADFTDENGNRILLPGGYVTLDGSKLRTYVTYRNPEDPNPEMEAVERRQSAVLSFFNTISTHESDFFSPKVYRKYCGHFRSNLEQDSLKTLLGELADMDVERITPQRVSGSLQTIDGKKLLIPFHDGNLFRDIVRQGLSALASTGDTDYERIYVIEVLNGCGIQSLARKTGELYQDFGFDVSKMANADHSDYAHTVVIDHIGNREIARTVADLIQCQNIESTEVSADTPNDESQFAVDFTVILGRDFAGRYIR